ncbi:hypothetical protein LCM10_01510 [Rossellomorea aquimaris]|uniref:hypothetical protein n=1 Tax=Rossellomorea aquimaris TaxID=189382 RepID=UPI001CD557E1|nr:hypothetical protein [Rossellomorea aquimaris]MCA1053647.1 hypothetical protein [Rossellomorea aquimaris]
MVTAAESKTLNQLIKSFDEASTHSKELEKVITNFTDMTDDFRDVLYLVDEKISASEIANLSQKAIEQLKEIKAYNEFEILKNLESVVSKEITEHIKVMEKNLVDAQKNSNAKIDNQMKKLTSSLNKSIKEAGNSNEAAQKQNELLEILQRVEKQTKNIHLGGHYPAPPQNNDEFIRLRKLVSTLGGKIKKIEEEYEERISLLENEIELLKSQNEKPIDINDDDLPF